MSMVCEFNQEVLIPLEKFSYFLFFLSCISSFVGWRQSSTDTVCELNQLAMRTRASLPVLERIREKIKLSQSFPIRLNQARVLVHFSR